MALDLSGRVALVTGAAGGIGQVITKGLLEAGASVVATDVNADGLDALARQVEDTDAKPRLAIQTLDISNYKACSDGVALTRDKFGSIDILINNGALGMGIIRADHLARLVDIDEISPQLWDRFIQTNLSGAWYLTKAAQPFMKANGFGRIITVTTSFFTMLRGKFHPYGPAKAGLEAMSAGHAVEFEGDGITVNVVVPGGPADTAMVPPESPYAREDLIPPGKLVPPIVWLCSNDANAVTGNRYVAALWDDSQPVETARAASEAPIAWPELAAAPVWPGGKPKE